MDTLSRRFRRAAHVDVLAAWVPEITWIYVTAAQIFGSVVQA